MSTVALIDDHESVRLGLEAGRLVRIADGIHYTADGLESIKREIAELAAAGPFTAAEVRDGTRFYASRDNRVAGCSH